MQLRRTSIVVCTLVGAAFAQTTEAVLKSKLTSVHYARLAEMARIQGDVRLSLSGDVITVVSGHPLLAPIAVAGAKELGSVQSSTSLVVTYHFVLVDTTRNVATVTTRTVKKGNAFKRAIFRVFGIKTEKVVHDYQCEEGSAPAPAPDVKVDGPAIEVWVYGRTHCPEVTTATLVATRKR
jgi:hypothetical protein